MKKIVAFVFALYGLQFAQNLDSLYAEFLGIRGVSVSTVSGVVSDSQDPIKCSTGLINSIKQNYNMFTAKQKNVLAPLVSRPSSDTSFVTPSGKFRIHYDKSGNNKPGYDLSELAKAVDSSYNYEVNILKYPPPISDGTFGGDNKYDIYIKNLSNGEYGYTTMDENNVSKGTNYIVIDNDFSGSNYATNGINAARVTAAHELHHAIQMSNYIYRASDSFYHEATSTAMEEFVYDDVNDYYYYIDSYFLNTSRALAMYRGYNLAIWNIFLRDRFGFDIIKRIWEEMPKMRAVEAFSKVLQEYGSSLKTEFNNFGIWCYFTNARAAGLAKDKYFKEKENYPLVSASMSSSFVNGKAEIMTSTEPISNNYYKFFDGKNTLVSIITNVDVQNSVHSPTTKLSLNYSIASFTNSGYRKLHSNYSYYSKLTSTDLQLLAESNILNDIPLNQGNISVETASYAYPQPFKYSEHQYLNLPANLNSGGGTVDVYIYSTNMNLVYSGQKRIVATEKIIAPWEPVDSNKHKLPTGVYFYVIKCGDDTLKGKFVIYND
ncbi:MAG: MXAN_6640 family putative metalloprotease [Bacteroidota bacterium]